MAEVTGTSKGNLQEALDKAITIAKQNIPHTEPLIYFTLESITGKSGGLDGSTTLNLTISYSEDQPDESN